MSVQASDLVFYEAANHPEDDTSTVGGAIATDGIVTFTDISAADDVEAVSDNAADTMNLTVTGRDAGGSVVTETKALTGTTPITFSTMGNIARFLSCELASAAAGTVTIRKASDDVTIAALPAGVKRARRLFVEAFSDTGAKVYYEKFFIKNTNGTDDLSNAQVTLTADPSGKITIALEDAVDDNNSASNRLTAPTGNGSYQGVDTAIDVPGNALAAGEAIGVWAKLSLSASNPAVNTSVSVKCAGTTT